MDETSELVTAEELREFLEADVAGVHAAPAFKRRLRDRLWKLMEARSRQERAADAPEEPPLRAGSGPGAR